MIKNVGIIGVGHLAGYLVEGLKRASPDIEIILSPRNQEKSRSLATKYNVIIAKDNQGVVDRTNLIILSTRPTDSIPVSSNINFHQNHIVVSVAVGLTIDQLQPTIIPARVIRALPISSSAINISPTLIYPDHLQVRKLFSLLGDVVILPEEALFTTATVITAFYGWIYALMDEIINWTVQQGIPYNIARDYVLKTVNSAVTMSFTQSDQSLASILATLATEGGITAHGLSILEQKNGLKAWIDALEAVLEKLKNK